MLPEMSLGIDNTFSNVSPWQWYRIFPEVFVPHRINLRGCLRARFYEIWTHIRYPCNKMDRDQTTDPQNYWEQLNTPSRYRISMTSFCAIYVQRKWATRRIRIRWIFWSSMHFQHIKHSTYQDKAAWYTHCRDNAPRCWFSWDGEGRRDLAYRRIREKVESISTLRWKTEKHLTSLWPTEVLRHGRIDQPVSALAQSIPTSHDQIFAANFSFLPSSTALSNSICMLGKYEWSFDICRPHLAQWFLVPRVLFPTLDNQLLSSQSKNGSSTFCW